MSNPVYDSFDVLIKSVISGLSDKCYCSSGNCDCGGNLNCQYCNGTNICKYCNGTCELIIKENSSAVVSEVLGAWVCSMASVKASGRFDIIWDMIDISSRWMVKIMSISRSEMSDDEFEKLNIKCLEAYKDEYNSKQTKDEQQQNIKIKALSNEELVELGIIE